MTIWNGANHQFPSYSTDLIYQIQNESTELASAHCHYVFESALAFTVAEEE